MKEMMEAHIWEILFGAISILGTLNAFFISRLVKKIEFSAVSITEFKRDLFHIQEKINELSNFHLRLSVMEKNIAVFEYVLKKHESSK